MRLGSTRRRRFTLITLTVAAGLFAGALHTAAAAAAPRGSGYYVTFVARYCPTYSDIFANRARNDIQESLKDLGPDTQYRAGDLVNPASEERPPQIRCQPIVGWQFTLGRGYESRAVTGPWGPSRR